jgi:hypothetical protein
MPLCLRCQAAMGRPLPLGSQRATRARTFMSTGLPSFGARWTYRPGWGTDEEWRDSARRPYG